ncbi:WD40-repeat-containing domain protein [Terfezia claveryi]|nr:WD40-repeat-containing domain protein [Terfezia claveryi]
MFVFPPPPPRLSVGPYAPLNLPGGQPTIVETANTLNHPTGPEYSFSVGEGTYTLREDIYLATPPPHPTEVPVINTNPLATTPSPPTAGTRLSVLSQRNRNSSIQPLKPASGSRGVDGTEPRASGETEGLEDGHGSDGGLTGSGSGASRSIDGLARPTERFGAGNAALAASMKDAKKRKPKNNINKSNSSFISRILPHEYFNTRLAKRSTDEMFVFANINRAFNWLDLNHPKKQDPLSKIWFTRAHPLCHDVNPTTQSLTHLDVIIGFSTGDIIWFDPMNNKYARINKNGQIKCSPVTDIKWLPESECLFLVSHADGSMIVYDKDKEDATFVLEEETDPEKEAQKGPSLTVKKSVESKNQKANPVAFWQVSRQPINAFAFSPDCSHLAVVSEDGCLRIIDYVREKLLDVYHSYYGGLSCVCWSPDGRYILTGGQDDLVSIWSFSDRRIVARCEGHHSWVTGVAFDPWRCDERTYRFGSVGEDTHLLLWDFSVGMLHRPKAVSPRRGSTSNHGPSFPTVAGRLRADNQAGRLQSDASLADTVQESNETIDHLVEPRSRTAVLPPIMSKTVDPEPLTSLLFREDAIITTCLDGHIRTWDRPNLNSGSQVTVSATS